MCDDPQMDMTLRFEIFPADLDAAVLDPAGYYLRITDRAEH
jgi:hypothetical protein